MAFTPLTAQDIITKFELYTSDMTELSSAEELDLVNKIYKQILADMAWEFLKKEHTATVVAGATSVALPSDFSYVISNNQSSEVGNDEPYAKVVFVFTGSNPTSPQAYPVVNWDDRRAYRNLSGYCWVDMQSNTLKFSDPNGLPSGVTSVEFDYIYDPDDLALADSPVFPAKFHDMIFHGMVVDDNIIQLSDKARAYSAENQGRYLSILSSMRWWNSENRVD
jgi:hypothetical protein